MRNATNFLFVIIVVACWIISLIFRVWQVALYIPHFLFEHADRRCTQLEDYADRLLEEIQ